VGKRKQVVKKIKEFDTKNESLQTMSICRILHCVRSCTRVLFNSVTNKLGMAPMKENPKEEICF
jgi:hypothetical protein